MKDNKGFTMVELLAVIVVLGIMMGVAIPAVTHYVNKGKDSYYENQKRNLISATKSYMNNTSLRPTRVAEFYDVSLEELIKKKYIDGLKDANKMDCYASAQNVSGGDFSSYTFVRVVKTGNGYKYIAHLNCPNYQDEPLDNNSANMYFHIDKESSTEGVLINHYNITIEILHQKSINGKPVKITDYSYNIYKNDNLVLSGTEHAGEASCGFEYDVLPYLTAGENTFKVAVNALDERGKVGATISTITINTLSDSALRCGPVTYVKETETTYRYNCPCLSNFGCKSDYYTGTTTASSEVLKLCDVLGNCSNYRIP